MSNNKIGKDEEPEKRKPERCTGCNRLLFTVDLGDGKELTKADIEEDGEITVKCGRCGTFNNFKISLTPPQNFQDKFYLNRAKRNSR